MENINIVYTDGKDQDFIKLCKLLDSYLNEIVGGEEQREQYNQYNGVEDIHDVVLIEVDDVVVGGGSFKYYTEDTAEIKRVFVQKAFRGRGLSNPLMDALEERAKTKGFKTVILETGAPLVQAMGLYAKRGYQIIESYGPYRCMENSICMKKQLVE